MSDGHEHVQVKEEAASILLSMQQVFSRLLKALPIPDSRPTDLSEILGLDYKICWQVVQIVRAEDPLSMYQWVPGTMATKKLVSAARSHGASADILSQVTAVVRKFHALVDQHSADRQEFDVMLSSLIGGDAATVSALQHRRAAFKHESQIWGTQVRVHLSQVFVVRSANGDGFDEHIVGGKFGLYRIRSTATPVIRGGRAISSGVSAPESLTGAMMPECVDQYHAPLLPQFCSQPIPKLISKKTTDGWWHTTFDGGPVGRKGAVDLVFGIVSRNTQPARDQQDNPVLRYSQLLISPTETAVNEVFVHRDAFKVSKPVVRVLGMAVSEEIPNELHQDWSATIEGRPAAGATLKQVGCYQDMLRFQAERNQWNLDDFILYRVHMNFPILHTTSQFVFQAQ